MYTYQKHQLSGMVLFGMQHVKDVVEVLLLMTMEAGLVIREKGRSIIND